MKTRRETGHKCYDCNDTVLLERVTLMMAQAVELKRGHINLPVDYLCRLIRATRANEGEYNGVPVAFKVIDWTDDMADKYVAAERAGLKVGTQEFDVRMAEAFPWWGSEILLVDKRAVEAARKRKPVARA